MKRKNKKKLLILKRKKFSDVQISAIQTTVLRLYSINIDRDSAIRLLKKLLFMNGEDSYMYLKNKYFYKKK